MNGVVGLRQHRPRSHQHQHSRRRRSDPHARHHRRHAPLPRRPAARARLSARRGASSCSRATIGRRISMRCIESRGEEIAVGIERAAAFLASSSRSAADARRSTPAAAARAFPGSTRCSPIGCALTVQQANPLANLKVRDGALESLVTDEVAPLLMLPIGLALAGQGRMIEINLLPGAGKKKATQSPERRLRRIAAGCSGQFRDQFLIGAVDRRRGAALVRGAACTPRRRTRVGARGAKRSRGARFDALRDLPQGPLSRRGRSRHAAPPGEHHPQSRRRSLRLAARDRRGEPRAAAVHLADDVGVHRHAAGRQQRRRSRRRKIRRRRQVEEQAAEAPRDRSARAIRSRCASSATPSTSRR